jgi:hypothetical protein
MDFHRDSRLPDGLKQQDARLSVESWIAQNDELSLPPCIRLSIGKSSSRESKKKAWKSSQPPAQRRILSLSSLLSPPVYLRSAPRYIEKEKKKHKNSSEGKISFDGVRLARGLMYMSSSLRRSLALAPIKHESFRKSPRNISSQETDASWGLSQFVYNYTLSHTRAPLG